MSSWTQFIIVTIYILQLISLVVVIFIENKDPVSTISWILVLVFLPVVGFILYIFIGRGLTGLFGKKLKLMRELNEDLLISPEKTKDYFQPTHDILDGKSFIFTDPAMVYYKKLIKMTHTLCLTPYTQNNDMIIYTDARKKYDDLFEDIRGAKSFIHMVYFIISDTEISHQLIDLLAQKAAEGVEVRLIYDDIGNIIVPKGMFQKLKKAGGEVYSFFPLPTNLLHANYRNHHKIVIIDGQIGYTGGMNIGDEYMGLHPRKTPWRDTHIRVVGDVVSTLQTFFLIDLFYVTNKAYKQEHFIHHKYFPKPIETGTIGMHVVTSGPDDPNQAVRRLFAEMIGTANKTVYIQTPYFMPDQALLEAIQNASASGIEIILMIPGVPDKIIPYHVTYSYIKNMLDYGVKVYLHAGFLHAKMIVIDDTISTIGTTNLDMRSLNLHFELNTIFYDSKVSKECGNIFRRDLEDCTEMTQERYEQRGRWKKIKERVFRLWAPMM